MAQEPKIRKNVWMPLLIVGSGITAAGVTFMIVGAFLMLLFYPLPMPTTIFFWLTWGFIIGGAPTTIVGLILLVYGIVLFKRERAYDQRMGLGK